MMKYAVNVTVIDIKNGITNGEFRIKTETLEEAREECLNVIESEYHHLTRRELINNNVLVSIDLLNYSGEYTTDIIECYELYADRYAVRCLKNGDEIECCATVGDAERTIKMYEDEDKDNGIYEKGFYEIYDRTLSEIV